MQHITVDEQLAQQRAARAARIERAKVNGFTILVAALEDGRKPTASDIAGAQLALWTESMARHAENQQRLATAAADERRWIEAAAESFQQIAGWAQALQLRDEQLRHWLSRPWWRRLAFWRRPPALAPMVVTVTPAEDAVRAQLADPTPAEREEPAVSP